MPVKIYNIKIYIKMIKIIFIMIATIFSTMISTTFSADDSGFEVIPENSNGNIWQDVVDVWVWGSVRDKYKDKAYGPVDSEWGVRTRPWWDMSLWDQFASGIMTWDTILDYAVYLIKFIWQLALLTWALMIIYLWYKKATEHLKFAKTPAGNVITWILVIIFAYVIVKTLWSMFIS